MNLFFFLLSLFFLLGTFFLSWFQSSLRYLEKKESLLEIEKIKKAFFYYPLLHRFAKFSLYETLIFSLSVSKNFTRFFSIFFLTFSFFLTPFLLTWQAKIIASIFFAFLYYSIGEFCPRLISIRFPKKGIRFSTFFASFFLCLSFPFTYLYNFLSRLFVGGINLEKFHEPLTKTNQEIMKIIEESNLSPDLDQHDKKLISSVIRFRERIAREIMVPRLDMFSLSADTSIEKASELLEKEGYSRVPVYKTSLDDIMGVLMYKDIAKKYMEYKRKDNAKEILEAPIETIVKNILYTPETKKISVLLQEFRKKQVHLAIVVDEYGGTEGIVTIEDILEEIVGDIEDEYDIDESLFLPLSKNSWLVDGRMNILDIEEKIQVKIPQDGDYDTIGGFIFHRTGMIPKKGYLLKENDLQIEVLRSNDRRVEKIRISKEKMENI